MMSVMPVVGSTGLEELDPVVQVGVAVVEEGWVPVVMVLQWAMWPVELELAERVVVVKVVASGSSPGRTAEVLL